MLRQEELELREIDVTDAYAYWVDECNDVQEAYESWSNAPAGDASSAAFAAYCAALEREEYASLCLQALAA
jgi:hypothetical protein